MSSFLSSIASFVSTAVTLPMEYISGISTAASEVLFGQSNVAEVKTSPSHIPAPVVHNRTPAQIDSRINSATRAAGLRQQVITPGISTLPATQDSREDQMALDAAIAASLDETINGPVLQRASVASRPPTTQRVSVPPARQETLEEQIALDAAIAASLQESIKMRLAQKAQATQTIPLPPTINAVQEDSDLKAAIAASLGGNADRSQVKQRVSTKWLLELYPEDSGNERAKKIRYQIRDLDRTYKVFQPIAGDGNCFYTAFAVDFIGNFTRLTPREKEQKIALVLDCSASPIAREAIFFALTDLANGTPFPTADNDLMLQFVECLRAIGVKYIRNHRESFFFDEVNTYENLVEEMQTMGSYAQESMMVALQRALNHSIRIIPMNGLLRDTSYDLPNRNACPSGVEPQRVFLYRGDHYDLLCKN